MKRIAIVAPLLLLCTAGAACAQLGQSIFSVVVPYSGPTAPALDGWAGFTNTSTSSMNLTLSTTQTNDIIVLVCDNGGNSVTAVSTSGLTWVNRTPAGAIGFMDEWYAKSSGTLSSATIAVTFSYDNYVTCTAFGVSGANYTTPFDTNSAVPSYASAVSTTYSTDNAADFVFAVTGSGATVAPGGPTGFTSFGTGAFYLSGGWLQTSSTQSGTTVNGAIYTNHILVDAIQ